MFGTVAANDEAAPSPTTAANHNAVLADMALSATLMTPGVPASASHDSPMATPTDSPPVKQPSSKYGYPTGAMVPPPATADTPPPPPGTTATPPPPGGAHVMVEAATNAHVTTRKKSRSASMTNAATVAGASGNPFGHIKAIAQASQVASDGGPDAPPRRSSSAALPTSATSPKGSRSISPRPVSATKEQRRMSSGSFGGNHSSNNIAAMDRHEGPPSLDRQKADNSIRSVSTSAASLPARWAVVT